MKLKTDFKKIFKSLHQKMGIDEDIVEQGCKILETKTTTKKGLKMFTHFVDDNAVKLNRKWMKTFTDDGWEDISYGNDCCNSVAYNVDENYFFQVFIPNSRVNDVENEQFSTFSITLQCPNKYTEPLVEPYVELMTIEDVFGFIESNKNIQLETFNPHVKKVIKKIKDQNAVSLQKIINDKTTKSMEDGERQLKNRIREIEGRIVEKWLVRIDKAMLNKVNGIKDEISLLNEYNATKDALTILYGIWEESDRQVAKKIKQLMQNERAK